MEMVPKVSPNDYFPASVSCRSHLAKTAENIKAKLNRRQLEMFRQTVFGPLLDLSIKFNGPLVHLILLREIEESRPNVVSYNILGKKVSFGKEEFDLITGLRHSTTTIRRQIDGNRLRTLYLDDSISIKCEDFEEIYLSMEFENEEDGVKMSLFYFIELVMMGRERRQLMDTSTLNVIDDWELFCNEDWSTLTFKKTISSLKKDLSKKAKEYKEVTKPRKRGPSYNLCGFPFAFQVSSDIHTIPFSQIIYFCLYSTLK